jgi:hypothetical protein
VQRGEHEVARLRRGQRRAYRLLVAHLTDEDHVGVLAQHPPHRAAEVHGVRADLALIDDRELVLVQVFDRVLERDDVPRLGRVDVVDHRGQSGRLARSGRTGEEDDPSRLVGQPADDVGQAEVLDRLHLERNRAEGHRDGAPLAEGVDAEPRDALDLVREVGLSDVGELLAQLGVVDDLLERRLRLLRGELGSVAQCP